MGCPLVIYYNEKQSGIQRSKMRTSEFRKKSLIKSGNLLWFYSKENLKILEHFGPTFWAISSVLLDKSPLIKSYQIFLKRWGTVITSSHTCLRIRTFWDWATFNKVWKSNYCWLEPMSKIRITNWIPAKFRMQIVLFQSAQST